MTSRSHLPSSMHLWRDGSNTGIRQSQSALSLWSNQVKLVIICNLFVIIW